MISKKPSLLFFTIGAFFAAIALYSAAAFLLPSPGSASLLPICTATGNCGICDIAHTFITLGRWLIISAGGLALVVMVVAGITLISSAGNPDKIQSAKKQIVGAFVGLFITFAAFQIVSLLVFTLAVPASEKTLDAGDRGSSYEEKAGLKSLLGVVWWDICNKQDLAEQGMQNPPQNPTASCKFWGDGTPCNPSGINICLAGVCTNAPGGSACAYLKSVDPTYKDYKCLPRANCDASRTEDGLCGASTVCCLPK